jgi:hypothetical protein
VRALLLSLTLVAACGTDSSKSNGIARDSAGIQVVENKAPRWQATQVWTVEPQPLLAIGVDEGDLAYQFHRVYDALRLADGTIVVGNSGSGEVRFYGPDGKHIRSVGRRGAGPGEFHEFSSLRFCPAATNELVVADGGLQRFHVFTNDGEYRRTHTTERVPEGRPNLFGCFRDGSLLTVNGIGGFRPESPGRIIQSRLQYRHYTNEGKPAALIAEVNDRPRVEFLHAGTTSFPYVPLTAASAVAAGERTLYVTYGGLPQIERRALSGEIEMIIRWPAPGRAASADAYNRIKEDDLESISDPQRRVRESNFYSLDLPVPDTVPAVQAMRVDELGNLWVERYRLDSSDAPLHDVFDRDGTWLGQVKTPAGTEIFRIGRDYLLGRNRDELGVERIVLHRLNTRST